HLSWSEFGPRGLSHHPGRCWHCHRSSLTRVLSLEPRSPHPWRYPTRIGLCPRGTRLWICSYLGCLLVESFTHVRGEQVFVRGDDHTLFTVTVEHPEKLGVSVGTEALVGVFGDVGLDAGQQPVASLCQAGG